MKNQEEVWDSEYKENEDKWHRETQWLPLAFKGRKVLELGVGNGKTLRGILKQEPKKVVAIDLSKEALSQIKENFQDERVELIKADMKKLPFNDEEFDVVVCYYTLNNLLKRERQIAADEIHRVLKKKGKLVFEDFAIEDFRETEKDNVIIEEHTTENPRGIICHFFTAKEVEGLFKKFHDIKLNKKVFFPMAHSILRRKLITGILVK